MQMDMSTLSAIFSALAALSVLVTGAAVWVLRATKEDLKEVVQDAKTNMLNSTNDLKNEIKDLTKDIEKQIDTLNLHVDQRVESVKTDLRDASNRITTLAEKISTQNTDFLEFKVDLPDQFVTRREMEEIKKRVIRLEGPVWTSKPQGE